MCRIESLTEARVNAESIIAKTEGDVKAIELNADAEYYKQMKIAEGIKVNYDAHADGLRNVLNASSDNPELAKHGAEAVKGLNSDIRVWNTGNSTENPMNAVTNIVQSLSPLFQNSQVQGGMSLPDWFLKFSEDEYKEKKAKQEIDEYVQQGHSNT